MKKVRDRAAKTDPDQSWVPGQKGQGGEGFSDGYGGSAGDGTGASGPDSSKRSNPKGDAPVADKRSKNASPALPSRTRSRGCCAEGRPNRRAESDTAFGHRKT